MMVRLAWRNPVLKGQHPVKASIPASGFTKIKPLLRYPISPLKGGLNDLVFGRRARRI
jgi:hypothetical protein